MADPKGSPGSGHLDALRRTIASGEERRRKARHRGQVGIWRGLVAFGRVGWAVVGPTVIGAVIGAWIDAGVPGSFRWTLALMMGGLGFGCFSAWQWVAAEHERIRKEEEEPPDA